MTPPLALSTMYFQRWPDQGDLAPFFALGRDLGFEAFELSHILDPPTVAALDRRGARITTVHHPCPRPAGGRPAGQITATDSAERARASAALHQTIATAARLAAPVVVLHLGRADDPAGAIGRLRFELDSRFRACQRGEARYEAARVALTAAVAAAEPAALERALDALAQPLAAAQAAGVRLAVETGYDPDELPTSNGMRTILAACPRAQLGAWLDTGHVGAQLNRGLTTFEAWFEAVGDRWLGVHYHDLVGLRDHLVPGAGMLDFAAIAAAVPPTSQATLEVDWYHEPAEIAAGAALIRAVLTGRRPLSGGGITGAA
jgi:sugar phosphate isomerase/epimerase